MWLPKVFFSLESFEHKALFGESFVWEALDDICTYLDKSRLGVISASVDSSVYLVDAGRISIGEGTVIDPGVFIQGPCIIGKHCHIRQGAYIRGNVIIGDRCVVGHGTEVKHSIFLNDVSAAHFNYVGDSILGNGVNLGAGVKCANLRLDHGNVRVNGMDTGMKKLGAVIGDGAQIGCNCVIDPGTMIGRGAVCYPCLHVRGHIAEKGRVKSGFKNIVE